MATSNDSTTGSPIGDPTMVPAPTASSSSSAKPDFQTTLDVTNIKNNIPFKLEIDKDHYALWIELFETHAHATQWICSTISFDLLSTVMEKGSTAMATWNYIASMFEDNQNSCAVALD
ncbi:uncharacterized protein LOC130712493 [Lotus japonicus]|uniref:uncharacterized protein LOC130712493 n=1 Tax=Lotus japonicus TaxID=34305 RepID=UPI002587E300|nr:uncharacterized protein LOC130712493 [Lotus japonicus]